MKLINNDKIYNLTAIQDIGSYVASIQYNHFNDNCITTYVDNGVIVSNGANHTLYINTQLFDTKNTLIPYNGETEIFVTIR